jgi:ABC-type multidrug transport system fused ATPase/permease subunit
MLVGTIQPAKGAIEIDGIPLPEIPQNRRRHIFAILPQSIAIFHDTLRSNLLLGIARPATVPVSDDEILRVLDSVGLPGFVEDLPNRLDNVLRDEYSAGQAQRVVLASTLLKDSDIYVFDEPTSALDSENVGLVRDSLTTLRQRGKTILLFTHETRLADICDQVHFLAGGALRSSEDPGPLVGEEQSPCGGRAHAPNCADATIQRHS